ncbi:MAG: tetratricopeptide repeat protein [Verrucomicrobiae bacterium]|nr:tetratricopeptide repeat protein [Verrucomicrobiae bacterium]
MKPLDFPDVHHLAAACGWLELGLPHEAEKELKNVSPGYRRHPQVLRLLCQIAARRQQWRQCAEAARCLTQVAPEDGLGWMQLAHSLHQLGQTAAAHDLLLQVMDMLEPDSRMALDLSCYACRLGHLSESQEWLARAFELAAQPQEREALKARALEDPSLAPLRDVIQHLV